jgi:anthranilate synthase component 2
MSVVHHGVQTKIIIKSNEGIFQGIPRKIDVGRYHSWEVVGDGLPENISIIAEDENGTVMALSDHLKKIYGIQFHPESVMTEYGQEIIKNFLKIVSC